MTVTTMTTTIRPTASRPTATRPAPDKTILGDVIRSEWTKLRGVRSTYWSLLAAVVAFVGISALTAAIYTGSTISAGDRATFNPTSFSLNGIFLAQLAIGVLGVLVITGEYGTGAIRSTFAAVPQRRAVLAAKGIVFGAVSLVVGLASSFAAFFVGQAILSSQGIQARIGDPGAFRSVVGAGLYLSVLGLFALGIGTLIRRTAGAISVLFGIIFVGPILVGVLPSSWQNVIARYLPSNAGQAMFRTAGSGAGARGGATLSPWVGLGVFCLYTAIVLALAAASLTRRDA